MAKIAGSGSRISESGSGSISQRHGSVDPRIRIHTKMSWIRNTDQGQPRGDCGRGDWVGKDDPADAVPARGRLHQVRHDRLHSAQEVSIYLFKTIVD